MTSSRKYFKWCDETTYRFLDLYRRHECLWNSKSSLYKNRDARDVALEALTAEMNIPNMSASDIKSKIKTVRTMYKRELTLMVRSMKSGTGEIYKPKLVWFDRADSFLRSMSSNRTSSPNLEISKNEDEYENINCEVNVSGDESSVPYTLSHHNGPAISTPQYYSVPILPQPQPQPQPRKRKFTYINEAIEKLNAVQSNETEDEFDHFGKLIASQLRKMSEMDALLCEEQIYDVIRKRRLHILNNSSQS